MCERVIVMNNGCLVADGATDTLAHDLSAEHRIIARIDGPESEILQAIRGMEHIVEVYSLGEKEKGVFEISIEASRTTTCAATCLHCSPARAGRCWL